MTCPIGGGSFHFTTTASYSTFGERPDGKPYRQLDLPAGAARMPRQRPRPLQGIYAGGGRQARAAGRVRGLSGAAQGGHAILSRLLADEGDGPRARSAICGRCSRRAGRPTASPSFGHRYLAELAEASAKVPAAAGRPQLDRHGRRARSTRCASSAASTRRWRGSTRCRSLGLDVELPAGAGAAQGGRRRRGRAAAGTPSSPACRTAIERSDSSIEPLDMIPRSVALGRCIDEADKLGETGKAFCEREIGGGRGDARRARSSWREEAEALQPVPRGERALVPPRAARGGASSSARPAGSISADEPRLRRAARPGCSRSPRPPSSGPRGSSAGSSC